MYSIRQKCRPKHQVLVLKCYPRTTKGAVDVKPNSSELSYLLYYATTRRSKIGKVGAFLEKKTASDTWRARIGNVQVTLQILAALIEKSPRDLPLYAPYVLKIFRLILRSGDIDMVESSLPTFEAFCDHHDVASLAAGQEYLRQYEEIVRMYAALASTRPKPTKVAPSAPVAMRWRIVGLQAVKSVATSEALASVACRQLDVIMPVLLENLWTDNTNYLEMLLQRAEIEEKVDVERMLRRRTSIATVRTVETSETNPLALSGTTADADKLAEEDIGVLAIQCLKQIFVVNNRTQIHLGTLSLIKFIRERLVQQEVVTDINPVTREDRGWAATVFLMISQWAPVQDRHIILVTAMESLIRSPLTEQNMAHQLTLASMVSSLLRSDVNLIGLSVMDVLLLLIQHVLRVLQLGGADAPQKLITSVLGDTQSNSPSEEASSSNSAVGGLSTEKVSEPSTPRIELLDRLQQCIGDLATHVYYADQISDMISALLLRLKPSPLPSIATPTAAVENPEATNNELAASAQITEDPTTDGFFSFDTAKITALKAIKSIIMVATQRKMSGAVSLGRNRVGVRVWEGTQWLLRDPDGRVRKAYVDALLTWLEREMTKADLRAFEDKPSHSPHRTSSKSAVDDSAASQSKRAISNASRDRPSKTSKTTFLQLLHLAVYENALQYIDSEPDVLFLHLLLVTLVDKLGINAVKSGLPMIFRLQEDIQDAETMAKVRMGSLCHGYFCNLREKFDFESSAIGHEIYSEISRRQSKGFWIEMIKVPSIRLDKIGTPGEISPQQGLPMEEIESESLKPFDNRAAMVELIAISYSENMTSPPNSPPTSPHRSFNHPILSKDLSDKPSTSVQMPQKIKEEMLSEWSRESVIAGTQEGSKTQSLNGSKTGTGSARQPRFLTVNGNFNNGGTNSGTQSPRSLGDYHHKCRNITPSQAYGLIGTVQKFPRGIGRDGSPMATSDSSRNSVTRVEQLKRVLSGQAPPSRGLGVAHSDASSESMISYDAAASELSYDNRGPIKDVLPRISGDAPISKSRDISPRFSSDTHRSKSRDRVPGVGEHLRPLNSNPVVLIPENVPAAAGETEEDLDSVPPVPPLPSSINLTGALPIDGSYERFHTARIAVQDYVTEDGGRVGRRSGRDAKSREDRSRGSEWGGETAPALDLEALINGIGSGEEAAKGSMNIGRPPY